MLINEETLSILLNSKLLFHWGNVYNEKKTAMQADMFHGEKVGINKVNVSTMHDPYILQVLPLRHICIVNEAI